MRRVVLDAITLACPAPTYMLAWMQLATQDPAEHVELYLALLAIADERDPAALRNAISSKIARNESIDPKAVRAGLANATGKRSTWSITRSAVVRRLPQLLALPLFATGGACGRRCTT